MRSFSESLDFDECEACSPANIPNIPTPGPAYPTPSSRSTTCFNLFFPPIARSASTHGSISSYATNVPTPGPAYPTAATSPRSSRAYSISLFPQICRALPTHLGDTFQKGNIMMTVPELPSGSSSADSSSSGSRQTTTPPSGEASPSTPGSYYPPQDRLNSSASSPLPYPHSDFSLPSRVASVPILPSSSSLPFFISNSSSPIDTTTPPPFTSQSSSSGRPTPPIPCLSTDLDGEKLRELLRKFDPRSKNIPELWPVSGHREMMRTNFFFFFFFG